jgi:hypothetical protein
MNRYLFAFIVGMICFLIDSAFEILRENWRERRRLSNIGRKNAQ